MGKRHNTLSDDIFRNSKYINTLEQALEIDDFRKEYKEADGELALFYEELSSKAKENSRRKDERWDDVPKSKPEKRGGFGFLGRKK